MDQQRVSDERLAFLIEHRVGDTSETKALVDGVMRDLRDARAKLVGAQTQIDVLLSQRDSESRDAEALSAKLAEVELTLAAEQADNARLREAALRYIKAWNDANVPGEEGDAALVELGRLANSPSSDAALREVCAQMGTEAVTAYIVGANEKAAVDRALVSVLGPEEVVAHTGSKFGKTGPEVKR